MASDLSDRTADICNQLQRYGGQVAGDEVADVLDTIVEINDDLHQGVHVNLIAWKIKQAKQQLDALLAAAEKVVL